MKPPFEAYSGDDPFIFVCYSHQDRDEVYPELVWLREQGLNIWYDEGIPPGEEWPERIAWAIENADRFLFYLTPDSTRSRICRDEVRLARTEGKPIVTVELKPTELEGGLELTLGSSQAIIKDRYRTLEDYRDQLSAVLFGSGTMGLLRYEHRSSRHRKKVAIVVIAAAILAAALYLQMRPDGADPGPQIIEQAAGSPTIAVLPLADMTPGRDLQYLGDGLAEELIHGLTQVSGLRVISRTSSFHFKDQNLDVRSFGSLLGVNQVLEGSIRRENDALRVTLQLIDVEDGVHIWSRQFDGSMSNIFHLQEEIARDVVTAIMPEAGASAGAGLTEAGTSNPAAYEAFLVGSYERTRQTRDSIDRAITQFQRATELDPEFFRAYEGLIGAYNFKGYYYGDREAMMALAEQTLARAKEHVPDERDPNWFWLDLLVERGESIGLNFQEGEALYSRMIRDRSHVANRQSSTMGFYQYGLLLAKSGFFKAATEYMEPLEALDPLSISIKLRLAELYAAVGEYDRAIEKYQDLFGLSPDYVQANLDLFLLYGKLGRLDESREVRDALATAFPGDLVSLLDALSMAWNGDREGAVGRLDALAGSLQIPPNYLGLSYLAVDEVGKAFEFFHAAANQGDPYVSELVLTQTRILPADQWSGIRQSDQFRALMVRFGYDESWPSELARRANALSSHTGVTVEIDRG
ncbi:MAG: TIR domain-containing protein [Xanthomonadales bacterium]|nr:TIR domain-containing protein [Xanthomonadales bacterium]